MARFAAFAAFAYLLPRVLMFTARFTFSRVIRFLMLGALMSTATGCIFGGKPSAANIELRKEKQVLTSRVGELEKDVAARDQVIQGLREKWPTIPTLPQERLDKLFTTHGLQVGRLTGGWDGDRKSPGDEGIVVYVNPVDEAGQPIKMVGTFTVEAFDLKETDSIPVGKWTFDIEAVRKAWRGSFMDYNYVLECPWQQRPKHQELTVKVTFLDELTQVPFRAQQVVQVKLPSTTTQPSATQSTKAQ
jgi:hypothetical protein